MQITAEHLRSAVDYDPETGVFTRKATSCGGRWKAGQKAGWLMPVGYVALSLNTKTVYGHRAAWIHFYGSEPLGHIDHINGCRADNRIANLRDVTGQVNAQNVRKAHADNQTGLLGVTLEKHSGLYMAQLRRADGTKWCKRFKTPHAAHAAYLAEKRIAHEGCTL